MQQGAGGHQAEGGRAAAGGAIQLAGPGRQHQRLHLGMLAHPEGNALSPLEVLGQTLLQFAAGMGQVGAKRGHGPFTPPAEAVPHLSAGLAGLHEQHEAFPLGPVRQEQGYRLRLIEAGEIPEIAVLSEGPLAVGVVNRQRSRRDHRRRPSQLVEEAPAPLSKDRRIVHGEWPGGPGWAPVWSRHRDRRWQRRLNRGMASGNPAE